MRRTAAPTSASRRGRRTRGRSAAAPYGAGSPTTPDLDLVYYGTSNPGAVERRAAARRQQVHRRDSSRAMRRTGQARWFYQLSPHDEFDYDAVNESVLVDLRDRRKAAQGARPSGSQRLRLCDGSLDRRGPVRNAVRPGQHLHRRRPRDGLAALRRRQAAAHRHGGARHLSRPRRAARTGSPRRIRRARSCSTSRTRTSARTRRRRRPATSPARPTSGRSSR